MNRQISIGLLLIFISLIGLHCSDDEFTRRRMTPQDRALKLKSEINLTAEQTKQVEKIFIESQKQMSEYRKKFQGDRETMRGLMLENREETDELIEEILTEEQLLKYQEYRVKREEEIRERRSGRRN